MATQQQINEMQDRINTVLQNNPDLQKQYTQQTFGDLDSKLNELKQGIDQLGDWETEFKTLFPDANLSDQTQSYQSPQSSNFPSYSSGATGKSYSGATSGGGSRTQGVPSNYTGYYGGTAYVGGTPQTGGGGFTPDGSYSAGYHGGGGGWFEDRGQWGTGMNMGPMVNGTVQTGGGGFTPDGSYSAGYHGSGEHPEITGESQPGEYQGPNGSFGPYNLPELSSPLKAEKWLLGLEKMGYNIDNTRSWEDKTKIANQFNEGRFDARTFIDSLANPNPNKTNLIFSTNAQTPLKDIQAAFGNDFSKLYEKATPEQYQSYLDQQAGINTPQTGTQAGTSSPSTLNDVGAAVGDTYVNPYTGQTEDLLADYYQPSFSSYSLGVGKSRAK
jgi:hypothetical protein